MINHEWASKLSWGMLWISFSTNPFYDCLWIFVRYILRIHLLHPWGTSYLNRTAKISRQNHPLMQKHRNSINYNSTSYINYYSLKIHKLRPSTHWQIQYNSQKWHSLELHPLKIPTVQHLPPFFLNSILIKNTQHTSIRVTSLFAESK